LKENERIGNFILTRQLGRGISVSTWLAKGTDAPDAVLKILDLADAASWNAVDIFRREADALKQLSHPGIPAYFESFETEREGRPRLVLAMEYIEGQDLEKVVKSGRKFAEPEVEKMLAELAEILAYLGSLRPPMVHRDVNPRNIILRTTGSIALVDFSGVQDAVRTALFPGATLVGTAGYIPLEQVAGRASHRSDLYGAAATAVFLLTGRNPAELPTQGLKIDIGSLLDVSARLETVLSSWLDPDVSRRSLPAQEAAAILRGETRLPVQDAQTAPPRKKFYPDSLPSDSKVLIEELDERVNIKLPSAGLRSPAVPGLLFSSFWIGFIAFWTMMTLRMRATFFFPLFSLPFWGVGVFMAKTVVGPAFTRNDIVLNRDGFHLRSVIFGFERMNSWPLKDIGEVKVIPSKMQASGNPSKELSVEVGTKHILLGVGLSERELLFLRDFLEREVARLRKADLTAFYMD